VRVDQLVEALLTGGVERPAPFSASSPSISAPRPAGSAPRATSNSEESFRNASAAKSAATSPGRSVNPAASRRTTAAPP
jgi:hypothetical protein